MPAPTPVVRRSPRGFTLLELLVGMTVNILILTAVAGAFIAIQRSYHAEAQIKSSVEYSRTATSFLERQLRKVGYGIDPRFAYEFSPTGLPGATKDNYNGGTFVTDDLAVRW